MSHNGWAAVTDGLVSYCRDHHVQLLGISQTKSVEGKAPSVFISIVWYWRESMHPLDLTSQKFTEMLGEEYRRLAELHRIARLKTEINTTLL